MITILSKFSTEDLCAELSRRFEMPRPVLSFVIFVSIYYGIPYDELTGPKRPNKAAKPRMCGMAAAYELGFGANREVALAFGKKTKSAHGCTIHARKKCRDQEDLNKSKEELIAAWKKFQDHASHQAENQ